MQLRKTIDSAGGAYRTLRQAKRARRFRLGAPIVGSYLISTEIGIAHVTGAEGRFLTCWSGYGIAIDGPHIYVVDESANSLSRVISLPLDALLAGRCFLPTAAWRRPSIYEQPYRSTNGRIHQVTAADGRLLISASERNAIVSVDLHSGETSAIHPFRDQFGTPIRNFDQNHINSAIAVGSDIFFVAYNAGQSSLIGMIRDGRLHGWKVAPRGYHDIYPTDTGFVTCDTFGNAEMGRVLTEQGPFLADYIASKSIAPRGIARTGDEWLIGHSHKGARAKRFKGKGALIIKPASGEPVYSELPCSQVYQIIRTDGQLLGGGGTDLSRALSEAFGAPEDLGVVDGAPSARAEIRSAA